MLRRLGIHIRTGAGLTAAAHHAAGIGSNTLQIMSGNPSAWNPGQLDQKQALAFRQAVSEHGLGPVFLHAGYLINISCRKGRNAPIYAKSIKLLQDNIDRAAALGCQFVVVHMGSRRGQSQAEALAALADGLQRLRLPDMAASGAGEMASGGAGEQAAVQPPVLLLENSAGSGDTVGADFEEIGEALAAAEVRGAGVPLGVCLDTAHMWGAGLDISTRVKVDKLVEDFDRCVGLERLSLVHFNDSPVLLGARRDKHEHLGHGLIPVAGLKAFARHARLKQVPLIMETPGTSEPSDEQRMRDLKVFAGVRG